MATAESTTNGASKKNGAGEPREPVDVKDLMQVRVIALYLVQKLHTPTLKEIKDKAKERCFAIIHHKTLERVLEGLSKAGFIAINMQQVDENSARVYSMKDTYRWKQPPEYAHFMDLVPRLLATNESSELKQWFDEQEGTTHSPSTPVGDKPSSTPAKTTGFKGNAKASRGNVVDDYHTFQAICRLRTPIIGSQIPCAHSDAVRKKFPNELDTAKGGKVEVQGIFTRDELNGNYLIPQDVLQGWFGSNVGRYGGAPDARAAYVAFSPVSIKPRLPVVQMVLPVNSSNGRPSAPKSYETIGAGEVFVLEFSAPTKGLFSPEQYEKLLLIAGLRPRRGISPARGRRFGSFEVLSFKDLGPVKTSGIKDLLELAGYGDDSMKKQLDAAFAATDNPYLREAVVRLDKVELRANFAGSVPSPDAPFPAMPGADDDADDEN